MLTPNRALALASVLGLACGGSGSWSIARGSLGPSGGSVTSTDKQVTVTAAAGAVEATTTVTIQPVAAPPGGAVGHVYEIGPAGTTFQSPITLTFGYSPDTLNGVAPEQLRVATYSNGSWEPLPSSLDSAARTVSAEVTHFSMWSLIPESGHSDGGPTDGSSDADRDGSSDAGGDGSAPYAFYLTARYDHWENWAGDFDGDGRTDYAAQDPMSLDGVLFWKGRGDGSASATAVTTPAKTASVTAQIGGPIAGVIDFDGDGKTDLVIPEYGYLSPYPFLGYVAFRGQATGTFSTAYVPAAGSLKAPQLGAAIADFDGDKKSDLLYLSWDPQDAAQALFWTLISYRQATGWSIREVAAGFAGKPSAGGLATGDVDGDGRADAVARIGNVIYLALGNGDGTFKPATMVPGPSGTLALLGVADLDHDGKADLLAGPLTQLQVLWSTGAGAFGSGPILPSGSILDGPFVGDFDGDGILDVLAGDIFFGDGARGFGRRLTVPIEVTGVADVNGDGATDLICKTQIYTAAKTPVVTPDIVCTGNPTDIANYPCQGPTAF